MAEHIQRLARTTFRALGCRDLARVEFFVTVAGTVLLNAVNTVPAPSSTAQPSITGPDSRSMPNKRRGFCQSYKQIAGARIN